MSNVHIFPVPLDKGHPKIPGLPTPAYAELAVTSNFSFLRGASHPEEMVQQAKILGLTAIGIADRNSVAGVVRLHMAAEQLNEAIRELNTKHGTCEPELKIAVGARLVFADGTPDILVYPQDRSAWGRLTRLLSVGKSRADKGECTLFLDDLLEHIEGFNLIVFSEMGSEVSGVVPAKAGTHNHRRSKFSLAVPHRLVTAYGSLPSRGRQLRSVLSCLKGVAHHSVWLAASMRYRGGDARR